MHLICYIICTLYIAQIFEVVYTLTVELHFYQYRLLTTRKPSTLIERSLQYKLGCVVRMVVYSVLPHAKSGPNDHRKDAPRLAVLLSHMKMLRIFYWKLGNYISTDFVLMKMLHVNYREFIIWIRKDHETSRRNKKQKVKWIKLLKTSKYVITYCRRRTIQIKSKQEPNSNHKTNSASAIYFALKNDYSSDVAIEIAEKKFGTEEQSLLGGKEKAESFFQNVKGKNY